MDFQTFIKKQNISMYRLSQLSGVPKTTINDICSGKSSIENCTAKTIYLLSKALNCTMEDLMKLDNAGYDQITGLPKSKAYLEKGLPEYLKESLKNMKKSWLIEDSGEKDMHFDIAWCELNADINDAQVNQLITDNQATYLREMYLRINVEDD